MQPMASNFDETNRLMPPAERIRPFGPTKGEQGNTTIPFNEFVFQEIFSFGIKRLLERDTDDEARLRQAQWDLLYSHRHYGSIQERVTARISMLLSVAIIDKN